MLNNITTIKTPITNTIQFIKIESKQIKAQTVPCFFSIKDSKKTSKKIIKNEKSIKQ